MDVTLNMASLMPRNTARTGSLRSLGSPDRPIQGGLGIAVIPNRAVCESPEGPALVRIPLKDAWASRQFHVVAHPREMRSATTQSFLDFLQALV